MPRPGSVVRVAAVVLLPLLVESYQLSLAQPLAPTVFRSTTPPVRLHTFSLPELSFAPIEPAMILAPMFGSLAGVQLSAATAASLAPPFRLAMATAAVPVIFTVAAPTVLSAMAGALAGTIAHTAFALGEMLLRSASKLERFRLTLQRFSPSSPVPVPAPALRLPPAPATASRPPPGIDSTSRALFLEQLARQRGLAERFRAAQLSETMESDVDTQVEAVETTNASESEPTAGVDGEERHDA